MWRVFGFSCLLALAYGQSTAVSQCTVNSGPLPINVYIEGCESPPCLLPQLQDVVLNIFFRAPHTIRSLRTEVRAFLIGNLAIPYDLGDESRTCNFFENSYCPVMEGEVVQYTLRMYIQPIFPVGVAPTLEFFVLDEATTERIFCLRVPIRIIQALPSNLLSTRNATVADEQHKVEVDRI